MKDVSSLHNLSNKYVLYGYVPLLVGSKIRKALSIADAHV